MKPTTEKRRQAAPPPKELQTEHVRSKGAGVEQQNRTDTDQADYRHERSEPSPSTRTPYQ